ncbi:PREDICTED: major histocompatibility complex class I-related gene protein-like [Gekko japonicus]|uniref:Major histocompatibility complex class I-related gene protein-like n=1 Tax=Gekko japonicus TaxID=146911 RepID=A0ABM1LC99_GEKJA|nr:PREDICTED: major histocompatibility complex class I-related gene protein-like [Gekko japonicus]
MAKCKGGEKEGRGDSLLPAEDMMQPGLGVNSIPFPRSGLDHSPGLEKAAPSSCKRAIKILLVSLGLSPLYSSPHSLCYFHTAVSEPSPGLPQFSIVGYVDDQPFVKYDSITRRGVPLVPWMEAVLEEDPQYWERNTRFSQGAESVFRVDLEMLRERYNQQNSTGLHTWQLMHDCEVGPDGRLRGGHEQYAYDGEDFLTLDRETLTWMARVPQAQEIKERWEGETHYAHRAKDYMEEECVEWLRRYLGYGNKTLLRTEAPLARVARKKGHEGQETLFCQLYGFYPKEIEVTWTKEGEDRTAETLTGGVVPNSDGTYHTWLSIEVDPKEKGRYRCPSNLGLILGILGGILAVTLLVGAAGVAFYMRRDQGSETSTRVPVPEA